MILSKVYEDAEHRLERNEITLGEFERLVDIEVIEPKQGKWIPCSERMPEDPNPSSTYGSKTYQVTIERGEVVALKWHKKEVRGKTVMRWEWSDGVIYYGDVLAWKPLSEPWRGAEDDTDNV